MPDMDIKTAVWRPTPEQSVEDVFDTTYKEKEGPKPPVVIIWRNVILMSLLHSAALYGLLLVPSTSVLTLFWSEYRNTATHWMFDISNQQSVIINSHVTERDV